MNDSRKQLPTFDVKEKVSFGSCVDNSQNQNSNSESSDDNSEGYKRFADNCSEYVGEEVDGVNNSDNESIDFHQFGDYFVKNHSISSNYRQEDDCESSENESDSEGYKRFSDNCTEYIGEEEVVEQDD